MVDNASPRSPVEVLAAHPSARILRLSENLGPAGGYARALANLLQTDSRFAWILDDDCTPAPNALDEQLQLAGDDRVVLATATWAETGEVGRTHGWLAVLLPRTAVERLGVPNAELFWWTEDTEYLQWRLPRWLSRDVHRRSGRCSHQGTARREQARLEVLLRSSQSGVLPNPHTTRRRPTAPSTPSRRQSTSGVPADPPGNSPVGVLLRERHQRIRKLVMVGPRRARRRPGPTRQDGGRRYRSSAFLLSWTPRDHGVEYCNPLRCDHIDREVTQAMIASSIPEEAHPLRISDERCQSAGDRLEIVARDDHARGAVKDNLRNSLDRRRDRRQAAQPSLDQYCRHAVATATRQHDDIGGGVRRGGVLHRSREEHTASRHLARERFECGPFRTVADYQQRHVREIAHRSNRQIDALLRGERAEGQDCRPACREAERDSCFSVSPAGQPVRTAPQARHSGQR